MCSYCAFVENSCGVLVGKQKLFETDEIEIQLTENILEFQPLRLIKGHFIYTHIDLGILGDEDAPEYLQEYISITHCPKCGREL